MAGGTWLDALLGRILSRDVELDIGAGLNFAAPLQAAVNVGTGVTDVSLEGETLGADHVAPEAGSTTKLSIPLLARTGIAAAAAGTAADTAIALGFDYRIHDVWFAVDDGTSIVATTARLRTASGGGGSALSSLLDTATDGVKRNDSDLGSPTVAAADTIYFRRSDRGVGGELFMLIAKV